MHFFLALLRESCYTLINKKLLYLNLTIMKSLQNLCVALLLMLSVSCSSLVHTDYEKVDRGEITAIDDSNNCLSIQSFAKGTQTNWDVRPLDKDGLSFSGLSYQDKIAVGDTVNIYQHDDNFIASRYDVEDAKNINKALSSYFWQNIADNWQWFLVSFLVICIVIFCDLKRWSETFAAIVLVLMCVSFWSISNVCRTLQPVYSGTITQITPTYVNINNMDNVYVVSYATLDDIATHQPVKVGQKITAYRYAYYLKTEGKFFFSTHKLNEKALVAPQSYPEIGLMTTFLFFMTWFLVLLLYFFLSGRYKKC